MNTSKVVLVHGIWVRGYIMMRLAEALRAAGFQTYIYSYPSTRYPLRQQAQHLLEFLDREGITAANFVTHSMGGLVLRHLAHLAPERIQTAVTMASPHQGSLAARSIRTKHLGWLLGKSYAQGLDGQLPAWPEAIPLGSLAGDRSVGLGKIFTRFNAPNDGTVQVDETRLPGMREHRILAHSHTGILYAADTAREIAFFLQQHCFSPQS
ncbi:MAG: alpha/beta hydrolase [Gammaproteobacteria bacterium]|nr:alpha/beta hydrolase [Gammaproteobacteria bacterium]